MNPARSVDEVRAIFAGRVRVSMVDAARAVGFTRPRLATLLRASGVAPRATETGRVATADVLAALAWAADRESVWAACVRTGMAHRTLLDLLIRQRVVVPDGVHRWHSLARAEVDAAIVADAAAQQAARAARDVARIPHNCPRCKRPCEGGGVHCSHACAAAAKRVYDRAAVVADVESGATWAATAKRHGIHCQTVARIMRDVRAGVAA